MANTQRTREQILADCAANDAGRKTEHTHPDHPEMWEDRTPEQQRRSIDLIAELDALPRVAFADPLADAWQIFAGASELDEYIVAESIRALGGR